MRPVPDYGVPHRIGGGRCSLIALALLLACGPASAPGRQATGAEDVPAGQAESAQQAEGDGAGLDAAALDALTAEVAAELRCLVCRNQSVLESSAPLSREMQVTIRTKLAAGESPDEVKTYFVSRYGEYILLKPSARGVSLAVYALPALVLLLGGAFLLARIRGWARTGPDKEAPPLEGVSEEDQRWLEDAIRRP